MSTSFNPSVDPSTLERARQQVNRLIDEVARLSESDLPPTNYYGEFLERVLQAIAAPAGAVWVRNPQGHLQLQYQINVRQVGVDASDESRISHGELLRQASQLARPMLLRPHSGTDVPDESGTAAAANPTAYMILLVPILVDKVVVGLVEIFQDPNRNPEAQRGFLQFLVRMAELASTYIRNQNMRQMAGQQQVWTQLEAYARQIHSSLNPTEVAYLVVNEGRRLLECDRVSIAVRHGKRTKVEAISGADVVEKRSNLVQLMRSLCDEVLKWGEKLVYVGTKDDSLPPKILEALDAYLAESNSKLLIVLPMKDEREANSKKPGRSVMVVESFEPVESPEQMQARLDVLSKHAGSALYNAVEHRRIPMRFIWQPIARVQEGLGGKARAIGIAIAVAVVVLLLALIFVPYPLKMEGKGQLLPDLRRWMYSPVEAQVVDFADGVRPGQPVSKDQNVILMRDVQQTMKIVELTNQIDAAAKDLSAALDQYNKAATASERAKFNATVTEKKTVLQRKTQELETLQQRINAVRDRPGYFWLKAPISGTVLNWDFRENLTNRFVKPSEQLLRIGDKARQWEIELKIPQKHIGQVFKAFDPNNPSKELDVDLLVMSEPTRTFKGKLARNKIAGEAVPNRDDNNESEPVVVASVRIAGPGIAESDRIPESLLQGGVGVEVHAKVRCGNRAMGYSLFYGLWEFFYEKVVFFF